MNARASASAAVTTKLTRASEPRRPSRIRGAVGRIHDDSLVYGSSTTLARWNVVSHSDERARLGAERGEHQIGAWVGGHGWTVASARARPPTRRMVDRCRRSVLGMRSHDPGSGLLRMLRRRARRGAGGSEAAAVHVVLVMGADALDEPAAPTPPIRCFTDPPTRRLRRTGSRICPFTGDDAIHASRRRTSSSRPTATTAPALVENPGDEGHSGTCVYAQIQILEANRGAMEIDDSAIAYTGAGRSSDNTFNIGGTLADVQGALASLVYVPPDDEFETTDQATVTLRISAPERLAAGRDDATSTSTSASRATTPRPI